MRINKFIASSSLLSRRKADEAIAAGLVTINGQPAAAGQEVSQTDVVALQGHRLTTLMSNTILMLHKPVGYVVSRSGQGSRTIYDLLPPEYQHLQPIGRLDKDSSGLLLLTDDGDLANRLTHPRYEKEKVYQVTLDKPLTPADQAKIEQGVLLEAGYLSHLQLSQLETRNSKLTPATYPRSPNSELRVTMTEGKNRQIRRTFAALGYTIKTLHRTGFGPFSLDNLKTGEFTLVDPDPEQPHTH